MEPAPISFRPLSSLTLSGASKTTHHTCPGPLVRSTCHTTRTPRRFMMDRYYGEKERLWCPLRLYGTFLSVLSTQRFLRRSQPFGAKWVCRNRNSLRYCLLGGTSSLHRREWWRLRQNGPPGLVWGPDTPWCGRPSPRQSRVPWYSGGPTRSHPFSVSQTRSRSYRSSGVGRRPSCLLRPYTLLLTTTT